MSLNIVDSLLDKLSFGSKDKNIPFGKRITGSQNFLGTNSCLSQSIPTEFHSAFIDNDFPVAHNKMGRAYSLDSKMNIFHYFESANDSLVGRVSKLISPMLNSHETLGIVPHYLEMIHNQELFMHQGFKLLCEEVENHFEKMNKTIDPKPVPKTNNPEMPSPNINNNLQQTNTMNLNKSGQGNQKVCISSVIDTLNQSKEINLQLKTKKGTKGQPGLSVSVEINDPKQDKASCHRAHLVSPDKNQNRMSHDLTIVAVLSDDKKSSTSNQTLNAELASRKNKELQKRSKKRRRRQKKNKTGPQQPQVTPSPRKPTTDNKSSDIVCDINVQFLLPNSPSFVISIESAEDDSDWDSNNADCDWLGECSELGLSGIFISNLAAPLPSSVHFSQLSFPCGPEEVRQRKLLKKVNDNWVLAMEGLDAKPRVATKVSFAPEDKLVKIVNVENFDRKGEWETYACERLRFKRRIEDLEKIISPCFSKQHREKILSRFQDLDSTANI